MSVACFFFIVDSIILLHPSNEGIRPYVSSMYAAIKLTIQYTIPLSLYFYLARIWTPQAAFACLSSANTRFPLTKVERTLPESSFPKYAEMFCRFCMNFLSFVQYCKNRQQLKHKDHLSQGTNPMFVVYWMAVIKFELCLRFPYNNVSMVSRQNSSLHKSICNRHFFENMSCMVSICLAGQNINEIKLNF